MINLSITFENSTFKTVASREATDDNDDDADADNDKTTDIIQTHFDFRQMREK